MTEKTINSHILKLSGKAELPSTISIGHNYKILSEGSVTKEELHDNEDGSFNKVYTFRPVTIEIQTDKGESLKLKDTRSASQLLRGRLWKQWQNAKSNLSFDDWYQKLMFNLITHAEEIAEMYSES